MVHYTKSTNQFKSYFIIRFAGFILALLLFTTTAKSQCPGATFDGYTTGDPTLCGGTIPGWTGPITQTFTTGGCTFTAQFCYRNILCEPTMTQSIWQIKFFNFLFIPCGGLTLQNLIDYLQANPDKYYPGGQFVPPCNGYLPVVYKVFLPSCLALSQVDADGTQHFSGCDDAQAYCVMTRTLCYQAGGNSWGNPTYTAVGSPSCLDLQNNPYQNPGDCRRPKCGP